MRSLCRLALVSLLALSFAVPAVAEDKETALALATELTTTHKAKKYADLPDIVARVPEVYKAVEDKAARKSLLTALASVAKDKKAGDARLAVVTAVAALGDAKGGWKAISRLMPDPKVEEATPLDLAVVKAAGDLAPSRATKPLIELVQKAKDNMLAREAALALGGYGTDKRGRVKILEELISLGQRTRPGRSTSKNVSPVARERWSKVGPGIVLGLNRLTGQKIKDFEEWELLYKDNKKRPKNLFLNDDE